MSSPCCDSDSACSTCAATAGGEGGLTPPPQPSPDRSIHQDSGGAPPEHATSGPVTELWWR